MFPYPFSFLATAESGLAQLDNGFYMELDGVDDYIDMGTSPTYTNVSISFWMKRVVHMGAHQSIFRGTGFFQFLQFQLGNNYMSYHNGSGWVAFTGDVSDDNWHHIVLVNDISATEVRSYVDGSLDITVAAYDATSILYQFGTYLGTSHFLSGKYDELATWDRILSPDEISDIYNATDFVTDKCADLNELSGGAPTAWYRMGD